MRHMFVDGRYLMERLRRWSERLTGGDEIELNYESFLHPYDKTFYYDALPPQRDKGLAASLGHGDGRCARQTIDSEMAFCRQDTAWSSARCRRQAARASSSAGIFIVAKLEKVSEIAYGRTIRSPWRMAPQV